MKLTAEDRDALARFETEPCTVDGCPCGTYRTQLALTIAAHTPDIDRESLVKVLLDTCHYLGGLPVEHMRGDQVLGVLAGATLDVSGLLK